MVNKSKFMDYNKICRNVNFNFINNLKRVNKNI